MILNKMRVRVQSTKSDFIINVILYKISYNKTFNLNCWLKMYYNLVLHLFTIEVMIFYFLQANKKPISITATKENRIH